MKNKQLALFIEWAKSIDPYTELLGNPDGQAWIEFGDDSVFQDKDSVVEIKTPELMLVLGTCISEFRCAWRYKNTTFWQTVGEMWGIAHQWIVDGFPYIITISHANFSCNEDMIKYIIMFNDGRLPDTKNCVEASLIERAEYSGSENLSDEDAGGEA